MDEKIFLDFDEDTGEGSVCFPVTWFDLDPDLRAVMLKDWLEILTKEYADLAGDYSEEIEEKDLH